MCEAPLFFDFGYSSKYDRIFPKCRNGQYPINPFSLSHHTTATTFCIECFKLFC